MTCSTEAALCAAVSGMAALQTRVRHVQGGLVKPAGPGRSRRRERSGSLPQTPWSPRPCLRSPLQT
eukprot:7123492-Heterocapsa_arctica.AAC.1